MSCDECCEAQDRAEAFQADLDEAREKIAKLEALAATTDGLMVTNMRLESELALARKCTVRWKALAKAYAADMRRAGEILDAATKELP